MNKSKNTTGASVYAATANTLLMTTPRLARNELRDAVMSEYLRQRRQRPTPDNLEAARAVMNTEHRKALRRGNATLQKYGTGEMSHEEFLSSGVLLVTETERGEAAVCRPHTLDVPDLDIKEQADMESLVVQSQAVTNKARAYRKLRAELAGRK